ncbi:antibiotic biosynthesis monooxygenase family protein [Marinobacteraceae bacterium S3BR75-40.1]
MIKVLIQRHIAESLEEPYEQRARAILQAAVQAPGFISGETLCDAHDRNHRILLSIWRSVADWQRWQDSPERKAMMLELNPMMDREEKITILEHT